MENDILNDVTVTRRVYLGNVVEQKKEFKIVSRKNN